VQIYTVGDFSLHALYKVSFFVFPTHLLEALLSRWWLFNDCRYEGVVDHTDCNLYLTHFCVIGINLYIMFDWLIDGQSSCASIDYLKFLFAFGHLTYHVKWEVEKARDTAWRYWQNWQLW